MTPQPSKKIALIGEAHGYQETIYKKPFVGAAGNLLNHLLFEAGILTGPEEDWYRERDEKCYLTNVFNFRPQDDDNNILALCVSKPNLPDKGRGYVLPALSQGKYVKPEFLGEVDRLREELEQWRPNIAILLGNTPLWAMCRVTGITKYCGAILESTLVPGLKCLPTFHPSALFKVADRRTMVVANLQKAKEESENPNRTFLSREVWLEPTYEDLLEFEQKHIAGCKLLSVDIETPNEAIACISIATDDQHAIVIPFEDERKPAYCYWPSRESEIQVWKWLKRILESPTPKLGQNFSFDYQWLARCGIYTRAYEEDTMLLHHALQPEERKGLGVLASLYVKEDAFKQLGKAATKRTKRDG